MEFSTLNGYKVKDKKAIRYYDTIADMKNDTTLKNGMHVKTKGYYSANDGGHGEYIIVNDNSLVDDGGSIHTLNNELKAELIINNEMNVECFGAYGDNTHDDYLAIQTAINKCNVVNLLNKTYLTSTINITSNKDLVLKGNKSVLQFNRTNWAEITSSTQGTIINNSLLDSTIDKIEISGITFNGNCSNASTDIATRDYTFDMVMIENVNNVTIKDCIFTNSYQGALRLGGVKTGNIINNTIYGIGKGALSSIILERNAIILTGSYYNNTSQETIYVTNTHYNVIGNTIYDVVDECFALTGVKDVNIKDNNIYNIGQYIIEYFNSNTNAENKIININSNNINNTGSIVFNFNNAYAINGNLEFNVCNNSITNIGGFTTYRGNTGYHYISTVKDFASLLYHLSDDSGHCKFSFENNYTSAVQATFTQPFIVTNAETHFNNNRFDITSLTNMFVSPRKYGFTFINNKVSATDTPATRYMLFDISCYSIIRNNEILVPVSNAMMRLNNIDTIIQNNKFESSLSVGDQYVALINNNGTSGTQCYVSGNFITKIPRVFKSTLEDTTFGTCFLSDNYIDISTGLGNHKFATISKQCNYPTTYND